VIAEALGASAWRFEAALVGEPGGTWRKATGAEVAEPGYGIGIVSRLPVEAWHVHRLAAAPVRAPVAVPGGRGRFLMLPDEPRVVLAAVLGPVPLVVATTHLSFVPGWNLVQLRRATRPLAPLAPARLLAGDLNVPGALPARVSGWKALVKAPTFPAPRPRVQIDHVLASGQVPAVTAVATRATPLSDHLALLVDFDLGGDL
jgi:endonuclease/exonuclease/phosphatase family metal-dependent hydrolase